jgi:hypothetical protein
VSIAHGDTTPTADSGWREMTWTEYYTSVMRDAKRRRAIVIWINSPEVHPVEKTTPASSVSIER